MSIRKLEKASDGEHMMENYVDVLKEAVEGLALKCKTISVTDHHEA
jgi:hypothetical protein